MSTEARDKAIEHANRHYPTKDKAIRKDVAADFLAGWHARGQVTPDLAEIKRLAEQDLKCPCCTGYAAILAVFNEKGNE